MADGTSDMMPAKLLLDCSIINQSPWSLVTRVFNAHCQLTSFAESGSCKPLSSTVCRSLNKVASAAWSPAFTGWMVTSWSLNLINFLPPKKTATSAKANVTANCLI